jgi:HlyD family secretion protein
MSNRVRLQRRALVRRGVPLALGGLLVTGTSVAWATAGDDGPSYRTAHAGTGSVEQVLTRTGTVEKVLQAAASFPVGGTVSAVAVRVGDEVAAGDVLARLDQTDLKAAVNAAKATLAKSEATLENDQGPTSTGSTSTGSTSTGSAGGSGAGGPVPSAAAGIDLTREVAAVNSAQKAATTAATAADAALAAQHTVCDAFTGPDAAAAAAALVHDSPAAADTTAQDASTDPGATDPGGSKSEASSTPTVDTAPLVACITAVTATAEAQSALGKAQNALAQQDAALSGAMDRAVAKLTAAAAAAAASAQSTAAAATAAAKSAASAAAATAAAGATRTGAGSTVPDAVRIAVDEAAIGAAEAALASAQDDLDGAVLRSPIDGVVGAMPFTKGTSASTSQSATILGSGGVRVTVEVPLASVTALKVGTPAQVSADGSNPGATEGSAGKVESVGLLPTTTSGTATYPVAVYVAKPAAALTEGSAATVALVLKSVTDVVTVPNSALTSTGAGSTGYVTLLENGTTTRRTVTYGAVGPATTEITSGLEKGATVVLADPSQDVPASSTSSTRTFGGGTFGGPVPAGGGNVVRAN